MTVPQPCGAPTKKGPPCGWTSGPCPHHGGGTAARPARRVAPAPEPAPAAVELPAALAEEDVHGMGWWLVRRLLMGELETPKVAAATAIMRLLAGLDGMAESEETLEEIALRGRLMHGFPPATAAQWRLLEERFSPEANAEVRRWSRALLEADAGDGVHPLLLGDAAAGELDDTAVVDDEDGGRPEV